MATVITNGEAFIRGKIDYLTYLNYEKMKNIQNEDFDSPDESIGRLKSVIKLGPEDNENDIDTNKIILDIKFSLKSNRNLGDSVQINVNN